MNSKQRKTLSNIFAQPARAGIRWADVESLFTALGATITQGAGSRVRVSLNGVDAVFHRPHPEPTLTKPAVQDIQDFLVAAGITP